MPGELMMLYKHSPTQGTVMWEFMGKGQINSFVLSILRMNSYTADNIQISTHVMRAEKMNCFALSGTLFHLVNANLLAL